MATDFNLLPLLEKKELAEFTTQFVFSTEKYKYSFLPGQYITIQLETDNGRKETHDFSIASSPLDKDKIVIVTKKGASDFKKQLFALEKGDLVAVSVPNGGFILDNKDDSPQVFIAGGIGITPFYSMLQYLLEKDINKSITLFASFSRVEDVIFYEELMHVQKLNKNSKMIYTISSPMSGWHGERGRINQEMLRKYIPDVVIPAYYIVGKTDMVDSMFAMLLEMGVTNEKIKIEYFTGY